jgi:hypothetical protein
MSELLFGQATIRYYDKRFINQTAHLKSSDLECEPV